MSTAARAAVLERITVVRTEPRHRSPVEAEVPESRTMAYVDLILAIGWARLSASGAASDTREFSGGGVDPVLVVDQARAMIGDAAADPVHSWLLDAFGWRIARTLEGAPPDLPLAPELLARRAALDRVAGYKVDRLRQETMLLDPAHVDPFDMKPRVVSRGRAIPERSPFDPLLQARRQLGHRLASGAPRAATLEAFLAAHDRRLERFVDQLVIAGVAAALEPVRGEEILDEAHAELARRFDLQLFRRLGLTYGLAPVDRVATGIERLLRRWPIITDALGTNSHFGIYALVFVDVLVGAVTDPARPD